MLNSDAQELEYIENIVSNNESYDELTSNNNVISYADYMVTIGNDEDNYVPPPVQKNDMILSVIEHMKTQVEKCNMVNQETQSVNESLTTELEQYKERVKILENKSKDSASDREKFLDCELRTAICDRNRKVSDYENQVFSQRKQMENLTNQFDECIKRRTTLSPHEIGIWEQSDIKGAFKKDVIPLSENLKEMFKLFEKGFIAEIKEMKDIFEQMEDEIVETILWYLDSGCFKHVNGHRDKLINFVSKFISTYVKGLGHNLFFVGQFCDSDLKVALRKHTCFVRNLEGVDLLSGSRGSNLYTISMVDMMKSSIVCLLSKASKTKSWLWHRLLSHLNFDTINLLAKQGLVKGLPKLKYTIDHLCSTCKMGKSKKESHLYKPEPSTNEKLQMLHMDLYRLMRWQV
ncbi:retrovirus-related pol polyprotein from transposon TNT 1-94 [Tanacetum coccineum]